MPRMNFGDKNTLAHCWVVRDDSGRSFKVSRLNDAERTRVIFEGATKAKYTVPLQLFHVGKMPYQRLLQHASVR